MSDTSLQSASTAHAGGYWEIWKIAYPLVIMSASHTIMQFCDRVFLSMRSTEDVAAALPAGILSFTLFSFFMVTINFTSALVSQYFGNQNREACVRVAWNGFYLSLFFAVLIVFAIPWLGLYVIAHSGHPPALIELERKFYIALIPSGAFVCICGAFFSYFSGQGKTWYIAAINLCGCLINIGLDYLLIFGKCGLPELGIVGAGLATSISCLITALIIFTLFLLQKQTLYPTRRYREFSWNELKKLVGFGTPAGLQSFLDIGAFTIFTFMLGRINEVAMAATTIVCSINMISFMPMLGLADATAILIGQYIGRGRQDIAEKLAYRAWFMALLYMLLASSVFVLLPQWLIGSFAPNRDAGGSFMAVYELARQLLLCVAVYNFFDATKYIFMGALRGSGDTRVSMSISLGCNWFILVPGVVLLVTLFHCSALTAWMYTTGYLLVEAQCLFWRFRLGAWKRIKLIERRPPQPAPREAGVATVMDMNVEL